MIARDLPTRHDDIRVGSSTSGINGAVRSRTPSRAPSRARFRLVIDVLLLVVGMLPLGGIIALEAVAGKIDPPGLVAVPVALALVLVALVAAQSPWARLAKTLALLERAERE